MNEMNEIIIKRISQVLQSLNRIQVSGRQGINDMKAAFDGIEEIVYILNSCEIKEKAKDEAPSPSRSE